jgi:hypothetical protein
MFNILFHIAMYIPLSLDKGLAKCQCQRQFNIAYNIHTYIPMTSSQYNFISITHAYSVFKECGPMITSIIRTFLQFNTLVIFIRTYIPSNKPSEF